MLTPGRGWTILEVVTPRLPKEMSEEQLKAFWEAIQADAGLQEKLSAAKDADAVVAIAEAAGFEISEEEVAKAQSELYELSLSDEQMLSDGELEAAGGGQGGCLFDAKGRGTYPDRTYPIACCASSGG